MKEVCFNDIQQAYLRIKPEIIKTQVIKLEWLKRYFNINAFAKLENQQISGSFKIRGAVNNALKYRNENRKHKLVVASAGGHGLAMAIVAEKFNIETIIVVPQTGSQTKKNRIASCKNVSLIMEGDSLEASTKYALSLVESLAEAEFVSPYNNTNIIEGQGTVAIEYFRQIEDLDTLVIPVGGGGLITGVSIVAKKINPKIRIIGVQAENCSSAYTSVNQRSVARVVNSPTFADGLAVNLEPGSITLEPLIEMVDDFILVTEEEIAVAVSSMLYHESLLLEGAAAVGIASAISGKLKNVALGKTGFLLTGGNVTRATLNNMLGYPFRSDCAKFASGLLGLTTKQEIVVEGIDFSNRGIEKFQNSYSESRRSQETDILGDIAYYQSRLKDVEDKVTSLQLKLNDYLAYCERNRILVDGDSLEIVTNIQQTIFSCLEKANVKLRGYSFQGHPLTISRLFRLYRMMLQLLNQIGPNLEWRSASYDQSSEACFFEISTQNNPGVNYNRYESYNLESLEKHLAKALEINLQKDSLLLTSSGMSAYATIESYLLRNVLKKGDRILIPHYIYFEIEEQISKLNACYEIISREQYDTREIIKLIEKYDPKVVFLDPLTNTEELRLLDYEKIIKHLIRRGKEIYVVFDGTMMSGQARPERLIEKQDKVTMLYYESCSKYLQLGLDLAMAGVVIIPKTLEPEFIRLRRNAGSILYDTFVHTFPRYSANELKVRTRRISSNAYIFAEAINGDGLIAEFVVANYPRSPLHVDYKKGPKHAYDCGGLVTFTFKEMAFNNRDLLNNFIEILLHNCREKEVQITKGLSFGFSVPRISAAASMAENSPPFLRLFVGDRSISEIEILVSTFKTSLLEFRDMYQQEFRPQIKRVSNAN